MIFMISWAVPSWQHSNTRLVLCVLFLAHDGVLFFLITFYTNSGGLPYPLVRARFLNPLPVELRLDIDTFTFSCHILIFRFPLSPFLDVFYFIPFDIWIILFNVC